MSELQEIVKSAPEEPEMVHCMALLLFAVAYGFDLHHSPNYSSREKHGFNRLSFPNGEKCWEWFGPIANIGAKGFHAIREDMGL